MQEDLANQLDWLQICVKESVKKCQTELTFHFSWNWFESKYFKFSLAVESKFYV